MILRLWSGALFLHVRDQRRSPDFVIETPEGVMEPSERGVYRLDVGPGEARVLVLDGRGLGRGRPPAWSWIAASSSSCAKARSVRGPGADRGLRRATTPLPAGTATWRNGWPTPTGAARSGCPRKCSPTAASSPRTGRGGRSPSTGTSGIPSVAAGWRPYSAGHWAWTAYGWTWVPSEPWGWAPSHYGRWGFDGAWFWIPGRSWGPAWVNWSVGGDYVGWCPLGYGDRPVYVPVAGLRRAPRRCAGGQA